MKRWKGYCFCLALMLALCGISWGQVKATDPIPADGALNMDAGMPLLRWTPAPGTMLANVYLGTSPDLGPDDLAEANAPLPMHFHQPGLTPGTTYYWRIDAIALDGSIIEGDVWMFVTQALTAYYPTPVDEGTATTLTPDLTWMPGQGAVKHHVYFSDNETAVVEGAAEADKGILDDPNYAPGELAPVTTYYWRVDEVKAGDVEVAGEVWNFTTVLLIDDFESYTDEVGERIFEVWVDGIGFTLPEPGSPGNGTGAAVGHDIWSPGTTYETLVETNVVHSGSQSMPLYYDNLEAPYHSEAQRTWAMAQDWTAGDLNTLTLHVQGLAADFVIPRVSPPPVIDGEVDEVWSMASVQELTIPINAAPTGPDDASATFQLLYDDENLYLLADITDNVRINDTAATWRDDSVEFYFDGDNTKGPQGLSGNARQQTFGWTTEDVQGTNFVDEGFELGQVDTPTGWRFEAKMPWQTLMGTSAPVGQLIGVDCFYNDDDDGGDTRESQIAWHATEAVGWETPSMWGTALVAAPAAPDASDQLYVVLEDAFTRTATVTHPDPNILGTTEWTRWDILLSDFADEGVDLASVKMMAIGIGSREATTPGASGLLFVDDVYASEAVLPEPVPVLTLAPTDAVEATGDSGMVLSINGIAVEDLILGTTTFAGAPKHAQYPPEAADDFDLATPSSGDDQEYIQTVFAQPVTTVFVLERGGNDSGFIQALDSEGNPTGEMVAFVKEDFAKIGYKAAEPQDGGGLVITSDLPISGIRFYPPADGPLGVDPVSVSAVPAQ